MEVCKNNKNEKNSKSGDRKRIFSYKYLVNYMFRPVHASSLAVSRILFGLLMIFDIPDERGGSEIDLKWGDPRGCYFPLFPIIPKLSLPWMCLLYGAMWLGALGISLGYRFKASCLIFCIPYWYLLLLDKSFWNNHSYLYGLLSLLFMVSSANNYWSIDSFFDKKKQETVPYWNYFIIKFQCFALYFLAGLKKSDMEWLEGYSMSNLGTHWVFQPFTALLSFEQIDYLIIHWTGFLLDLTVGFLLMYGRTRPIGFIFATMFHLMNSRLFSIGMFPYVCLATMPLFCEADWPIQLFNKFNRCKISVSTENKTSKNSKHNQKQHFTMLCLFLHCFLQIFLPYSHFITKGYNNWTNGLYGYSWDMMIHSWDTTLVVVRIVDNKTGKEHFLDPGAWTINDRWNKHADMCMQYAACLKENLVIDAQSEHGNFNVEPSMSQYITSENISVYVDVWCSLNGRFQQRMYDPNYDLLQAKWSPFEPVEWLLPLLTEYSGLRNKIKEIQADVYSWSNYSDVLFIADFPGLYLENYITPDLANVTLTVIEGDVFYESEDEDIGINLGKGSSIPIVTDVFHRIYTISSVPSCFMYTYINTTKEQLKEVNSVNTRPMAPSPFPILENSGSVWENFLKMCTLIGNSCLNLLYQVPMITRNEILT